MKSIPRIQVASLLAVCALLASRAFAGTLTIYAIPSPQGIDWSTPKTLAWSAARNQISRETHTIGHANIHLSCLQSAGDDEDFEILTGMTTSREDPTMRLLQQEGYGLGILFTNMRGRLESKEEVATDLYRRFRSGKVNFLQFRISAPTCSRLVDYVTEYQSRGHDQSYGLPNRPRHGEGAGCSAFAASFMDLAGLHAESLRSRWIKTRFVPEFLTGGPLTGNFVPPLALMRPLRPLRWATPDEPHFPIQFFDPDALFSHVKGSWTRGLNPLGDASIPAVLSNIGRAKGFVLDALGVPTPDEPIWQ